MESLKRCRTVWGRCLLFKLTFFATSCMIGICIGKGWVDNYHLLIASLLIVFTVVVDRWFEWIKAKCYKAGGDDMLVKVAGKIAVPKRCTGKDYGEEE